MELLELLTGDAKRMLSPVLQVRKVATGCCDRLLSGCA
jgi:hypothetical protein